MEEKIKILEQNNIKVLEVKTRLKMIIVKKHDLDRASQLVNDGEFKAASRY